ncbi:hypothetical protein TNCV_1669801 [Trichonephila clavipes]|nr:hypothetical protein TNCV_1669801 [Trichonephila clavipes]
MIERLQMVSATPVLWDRSSRSAVGSIVKTLPCRTRVSMSRRGRRSFVSCAHGSFPNVTGTAKRLGLCRPHTQPMGIRRGPSTPMSCFRKHGSDDAAHYMNRSNASETGNR